MNKEVEELGERLMEVYVETVLDEDGELRKESPTHMWRNFAKMVADGSLDKELEGVGLVRKEVVRQLLADYMYSEGCSCCQDTTSHDKQKKQFAELLGVPAYDDNSGYDFFQFKTKKEAGLDE